MKITKFKVIITVSLLSTLLIGSGVISNAYSAYLSPSTQSDNEGVGDYGTEDERMNQIADVVEKILKREGITLDRNSDCNTFTESISDSNSINPDIHVAIHSNAGDSSARGCEIYAYTKGCEGDKLAQKIYSKISALTPTSDRGIKYYTDGYTNASEVQRTTAPAVLIEVAFHSNEEDADFIVNNIDKFGTAIAKGILEYWGRDTSHISDTGNVIPTEVYRIRKSWEDEVSQVGAFAYLDNAVSICDKYPGYSVFDSEGKIVYTAK